MVKPMKRYRVLNPRSVKGAHILRYQPPGIPPEEALVLYEGDVFTPPKGFNVTWALERGLIEEVAPDG